MAACRVDAMSERLYYVRSNCTKKGQAPVSVFDRRHGGPALDETLFVVWNRYAIKAHRML